jgi:hypothetical protein
VQLPERPGPLSVAELRATVDSIAAAQQPSGALPWADGHTDAWDHVECAMALTLWGRLDEARAAYGWLRHTQAADGAWAMSYDGEKVLDPSVDTNQCAYIAVGVWQWHLVTGERSLVEQTWPYVKRALDFVLRYQAPAGHLYWSRNPAGGTDTDALLTGSSSSYQALRCGIALAELLGESRFSMDWYYPVLGGAVRGAAADELLESRWPEFIVPGLGARCVADRPWVTGAETAELALTLAAIGDDARASDLLAQTRHLRVADGSYWTGYVFEDDAIWPEERSSWTAAAVVLAADAIAGGTSYDLFAGHDLPTGIPAEDCCDCSVRPESAGAAQHP